MTNFSAVCVSEKRTTPMEAKDAAIGAHVLRLAKRNLRFERAAHDELLGLEEHLRYSRVTADLDAAARFVAHQ